MAGTLGSGRRSRGGIVGINVTPMVDVVLVLLVVLMVSATYVVSQSLKVDLPASKTSDGGQATTAIVVIDADGALHFNDEAVDEAKLVERLKGAGRDSQLTLVVSADKAADHGNVVHVLDLARRENITRFAVQVAQGEP